jgi:hypothetical protein
MADMLLSSSSCFGMLGASGMADMLLSSSSCFGMLGAS